MYALVKCTTGDDNCEYLILAEKRIGEFLSRGTVTHKKFEMKTLFMIPGDQLKDVIVSHPLINSKKEIPAVIYNNVTSTYGTGINCVIPGHDIESLKIA